MNETDTTPVLTPTQLLVMQSIATQSMMNPEYAAEVFVNPREKLLTYNLSQADIDNITAYFNHVKELIGKDVKSDWY